ncbi:MAG TPA: MotA/TolQ/ExbB proton channel family protein [Alphaproteobacteria bacterium]|nr:MotA/TolQ/ExbB proton channel family protein [Alphaproteobacteria bacterium]USO04677.1 MAG: MotA/TolQ/ExbB proton channel family protein [Rhodospirillales bacterium]HOO81754.1 MotA/TolQ/ExbB proton channel family protein [Alphaproteobacteria bacterium]
MSDAASQDGKFSDSGPMPVVSVPRHTSSVDFATILGLFFTFGLIIAAIAIGDSNANFIEVRSLMIVLLGTLTATAISYTPEELSRSGAIFSRSVFIHKWNPTAMAANLVSLAVIAKKKGVLALTSYESELRKDAFLYRSFQMVVDGFPADDIEFLLTQELEAGIERHKRSASITRRASEIAPAMGLIGTLIGLVMMLADLENPETIGPAMAVALLTTFYGAILGTIVMAPLAVKLEKRSSDESLIKRLIKIAAVSVARQENPRKLEMLLNSELPPAKRIRYFD